MSEKILFGNNVGYRINSYVLKKKIIDYLLDHVEEYKLTDTQIKEESNLLDIKNNKFYLSPNIVGDDYIFISVKLNDCYYVCLIEKKSLDFKNFNKINIISVKIRLKLKSYDGCIFEGRIVNLGGCCAFIISKPHLLFGKNNEETDLISMLNQTEEFVNESYIIDSNMTTILFKMNKIYEVGSIDSFVNEIMKNSKFKFSSLDFIKDDLTKTYRYYFTNQDIEEKYTYVYGKLINVDVVELFAYDKDEKLRRIDIANVPNIKTSKICNEYVSSKDFSVLYCKFDYRFKKWTPLEIILNENQEVDKYEHITNLMLDVISH